MPLASRKLFSIVLNSGCVIKYVDIKTWNLSWGRKSSDSKKVARLPLTSLMSFIIVLNFGCVIKCVDVKTRNLSWERKGSDSNVAHLLEIVGL